MSVVTAILQNHRSRVNPAESGSVIPYTSGQCFRASRGIAHVAREVRGKLDILGSAQTSCGACGVQLERRYKMADAGIF